MRKKKYQEKISNVNVICENVTIIITMQKRFRKNSKRKIKNIIEIIENVLNNIECYNAIESFFDLI